MCVPIVPMSLSLSDVAVFVPSQAMHSGGYYVFTVSRCPVPTRTCSHGGQVHYIHAAAEASYDRVLY